MFKIEDAIYGFKNSNLVTITEIFPEITFCKDFYLFGTQTWGIKYVRFALVIINKDSSKSRATFTLALINT